MQKLCPNLHSYNQPVKTANMSPYQHGVLFLNICRFKKQKSLIIIYLNRRKYKTSFMYFQVRLFFSHSTFKVFPGESFILLLPYSQSLHVHSPCAPALALRFLFSEPSSHAVSFALNATLLSPNVSLPMKSF